MMTDIKDNVFSLSSKSPKGVDDVPYVETNGTELPVNSELEVSFVTLTETGHKQHRVQIFSFSGHVREGF